MASPAGKLADTEVNIDSDYYGCNDAFPDTMDPRLEKYMSVQQYSEAIDKVNEVSTKYFMLTMCFFGTLIAAFIVSAIFDPESKAFNGWLWPIMFFVIVCLGSGVSYQRPSEIQLILDETFNSKGGLQAHYMTNWVNGAKSIRVRFSEGYGTTA